ncbi:MAG: hypothetical protein ACKVH0_06635 [Alphaproteobacteria bacterium]
MAAAVQEAASMQNGAARTRASIAIARIQAAAGMNSHARDALRQTAEAIWKATRDARSTDLRIGLLAEVAEGQCGLKLHEDASRVLDTATKSINKAGAGARVRLLRAALLCGDVTHARSIEGSVTPFPSADAVRAFARQALPVRAEQMLGRLPDATRRTISADVARDIAAAGYLANAQRIDPRVRQPPAKTALPTLLAQAEMRRQTGDNAGARGFLAYARQHIEAAPAFKPALATAYADANDIDTATSLILQGADTPEVRSALALAHARARDIPTARRWLTGVNGLPAVAALAAIARVSNDGSAAKEAARLAARARPGRARAEALAHAATAAINLKGR